MVDYHDVTGCPSPGAADEVESLRDELAEIKRNAFAIDHHDDYAILYGTEKACEIACRLWGEKDQHIEELEEKLQRAVHVVDDKDQHIEELEGALSKSIMHQKELDRCVHITPKQINAAWRMANDDYDPVYTVGITEGFAILKAFNIVDCEECGGSGSTMQTLDHNGFGEPIRASLKCPVCGGHGWKVVSNE